MCLVWFDGSILYFIFVLLLDIYGLHPEFLFKLFHYVLKPG
jgi:hypothetical protein